MRWSSTSCNCNYRMGVEMNMDIGIVTESRPFTITANGLEIEKDKDGLIVLWLIDEKNNRIVSMSDHTIMGKGDVLRIAPMEIKVQAWFGR